MLKFSGRLMEEKLKIGWTIDDFLSYLNVSETEFLNYLTKNFSAKAVFQMKKRLKNNQKKIKKYKNKKEGKSMTLSTKESAPVTANESKTSIDSTSCISIVSLRNQEKTLVETICKMETDHAKLISKRASLKSTFQQLRKQLIALQKELKEKKIIADSTYQEWLQISSEMHAITESISKEKNLLSGIREEIKAAETISIFIYENGEIETENYPLLISKDLNSSEIFNSLLKNSIVESLTLRDIRQLAKVLAITTKLKAEQKSFEVTFESEQIQEVFQQIN